jgi:hypothetical protein
MVWMMKTNDALHATIQKNFCNGSKELNASIIVTNNYWLINTWPGIVPLFTKIVIPADYFPNLQEKNTNFA